ELHDLLCALVLSRPMPELEPAFEALCAAGRAAHLDLAGARFWCTAERQPELGRLFPEGRFSPSSSLRASLPPSDGDVEPESLALRVVRAHLAIRGPSTLADLCAATGLDEARLNVAIAGLEREGFVFRGRFDSRQQEQQFCSRRLLARIHVYTQKRLRREIEPVTAQDFMRFLLQFQHVSAESRLDGLRGVLAAIEQLQGFEAAAAAWEPELLRARVRNYEPSWLDAHCWSGDVAWGRLTPRSAPEPGAWASLSSATPVTLALRNDFGWLMQAVRGTATPTEVTEEPSLSTLGALAQHGALFFAELLQHTGLSAGEVRDALWDGVARGLVTSDGLSALRSLLSRPAKSMNRVRRLRGLRQGVQLERPREGRWALLP